LGPGALTTTVAPATNVVSNATLTTTNATITTASAAPPAAPPAPEVFRQLTHPRMYNGSTRWKNYKAQFERGSASSTVGTQHSTRLRT